MKRLPLSVLLIATGELASCGGGGSKPVQGISPGGIWRGTDSASGLFITGIVDEAGSSYLIRADNALFVGQASTSGNSITIPNQGYAASTMPFPDGSKHGVGTISGTIQERHSISASNQFTTDAGTSTQGTLDLTFDPLYNRPSSLTTVAGSFLGDPAGPFEIDASGVISQVAPMCQEGGQISIINPAYNVYQVHLTVTCHGAEYLSGDGLATLDNTVSPERLIIGVVGSYTGAAVWPRCDPQTQIC